MMYSEIIAVCSEIHTENNYTLCGQNVGAHGFQNAANQSRIAAGQLSLTDIHEM
jgi:hypothetical protein